MENIFKGVHYKTIPYKLNPNNGYYEKQNFNPDFKKLPCDLKIEKSVKDFLINQGANDILRGRVKNGKYNFFTGLIPINNCKGIYFGNLCEFIRGQKKISLLIVEVSENYEELTVYFFNHYYKENRNERITFVIQFIESNINQFLSTKND